MRVGPVAWWLPAVIGLSTQAAAQTAAQFNLPIAIGITADGGAPFSAASVDLTSPGSGTNGPQTAQIAANVHCSKTNYPTATTVGEVDCIYATLRQDGPGSDGSGLLIDAGNTGLGFLSDTEMVANAVSPVTGVTQLGLDVQEGVINLGTTMYGAVYTAKVGTGDTALLVQTADGAGWNYALRASSGVGAQYFSLDSQGNTVQAGAATIGQSLSVAGVLKASASQVESMGGTRTARRDDCGAVLRSGSDTPLRLRIPSGLPVGCRIEIIQAGRGAVLIAGVGDMQVERLGAQSAVQATAGRFAQASLLIDSKTSALVDGEVADAGGQILASADRDAPIAAVSWRRPVGAQ